MRYMRCYWLLVGLGLGSAGGIGCATSSPAAGCAESGCDADAGPVDAAPDGPPLAGFGEPCQDKAECDSGICIFVGIGGVCTDRCLSNDCPEGWGCYGVPDQIEPGEVIDVCVPDSDQLCTTCTVSTECAVVGMDLCLEYDNGKKFCSRDCSAVQCPDGYECETVNVDGTDRQQCIPVSGYCDCDDTTPGAVEPCAIATPFGTCAGARTCQGIDGWSACEPPSPGDAPDGTFTDDNCDGIDGDVTRAIFVAAFGGQDTAGCGLTFGDPCQTIAHGITRAIGAGRNQVYVQAGDYPEVVALLSGISVYGGYDTSWQRAVHTQPGHQVRILGGLDDGIGGDSEYLAIRAHNLIVPTVVADLSIVGPDVPPGLGNDGKSSYAVHAHQAALVLERVTIEAGDGAAGAAGVAGTDAPTVVRVPAMNGGTGGPGQQLNSACNSSTRGAAGTRGTNSCSGGSVDRDGGAAGRGGTIDSSCGFPPDFDATNGEAGVRGDDPAKGGSAGGGGPGRGSSCNPAGAGGAGSPGLVTNGARGTGGAAGGFLLSQKYWRGLAGSSGATGDHGGGGGGGGGSGGCDDGIDSYGAGGGGGGAGGCRAQSGGGAGGGGGGSFGIFAAAGSQLTVSGCAITRGAGGAGGVGGAGGRGQSGGLGGNGGDGQDDSADGGAGGAGAHGGHGGGGGGGAGGISAGIYTFNATVTHNCTVLAGSVGMGGAGGLSAPSAPAGERDGNDGLPGASGSLLTVGSCADPSGC